MNLRDFIDARHIALSLAANDRDGAIAELVALLELDDENSATLLKAICRRETLGSTGVGRCVAIPHCRSLAVQQLQVAFGRHIGGLAYDAIDQQPVHYLFLIIAPPVEVSNVYLPVLGRIAQLAKEPDVPERLRTLQRVDDFYALLEEKGV